MDTLSATFAALADPTRRSMLAQLAKGEATVNELAAPFAMSLPSVSRHLKVLEKAGLVSKRRSAQWRRCQLEVAPLQSADAWMAPYRAFFEHRFDRLEAQLKTMVVAQGDGPTHPPKPNTANATAVAQASAKGRRVKGRQGNAPQA
jgi:DNA-binding transcriptional ArsR family regulator